MRILYIFTSVFGMVLGFASLILLPRSPFVPFNWYGLLIFTIATIAFALSFKFRKIGPYVLFLIGILAMLNTYFYFRECSQIKGIELFGGFFLSLAPIFWKEKKKA